MFVEKTCNSSTFSFSIGSALSETLILTSMRSSDRSSQAVRTKNIAHIDTVCHVKEHDEPCLHTEDLKSKPWQVQAGPLSNVWMPKNEM